MTARHQGPVLQSRTPPQARGRTLAAWLAQRFSYLDEDAWRAEIAAGRVERNGVLAGPEDVLAAGDAIAYRPEPAAPRAGVEVAIVHDDPDFCVVDKPPFLVVQNAGAFAQNTFLSTLTARLSALGQEVTLEPVHRLDRETSGLLLLAKNPAAARALQQQFEHGRVGKEYHAIVHGVIAADALVIDAKIGRDPSSRVAVRRAVVAVDGAKAQAARTEITVLQRFAAHTVVACVPHTGRTHQLRVHLAHLGHPILGDKLYGRSDDDYEAYVQHLKQNGDPAWDSRLGAPRHMLHARRLAIEHPRTGARLKWLAPDPPDWQRVVTIL